MCCACVEIRKEPHWYVETIYLYGSFFVSIFVKKLFIETAQIQERKQVRRALREQRKVVIVWDIKMMSLWIENFAERWKNRCKCRRFGRKQIFQEDMENEYR